MSGPAFTVFGMTDPDETDGAATAALADSRRVLSYLTARESDDYIAIMDVLEASVTDLTPGEVHAALRTAGHAIEPRELEVRLDALRDWGAASTRTDNSRILRYADLLSRNWRYAATPTGRQVQRFYRTVLANTPVLREIPLTSLNRIVTVAEALAEQLADGPGAALATEETVERVALLFNSHDDLDGALVGAEDSLAGLADRFDLDDERTAELKGLLVDYATRVAAELDSGSARAYRALCTLAPYVEWLAELTVSFSSARALIERGALTASRGGRTADWDGLLAWCDPERGRANRFSLRLVRTLPGMHANLRRLHSSSGVASSRSRALAFARASLDPDLGTQIWQAVLGDHPWRKLSGEADDSGTERNPSWHGGPTVPVPELLRQIGRSGPRGRGGKARDDSLAREHLRLAREQRAVEHTDAVAEVLAALPGADLGDTAARAALAAVMVAARTPPRGPTRTAQHGGLACTLVHVDAGTGTLVAPTWRVLLPGRIPLFHRPGRRPSDAALAELRRLTPVPDRAPTVKVSPQPIGRVA